MFADAGGAGEEGVSDVAFEENFFHDGAVCVQKVHIFFWQTTVVHHTDPLFTNDVSAGIAFHNWFVTHIKSTHKLESWDFNREVKRSDHCNCTKWPSITSVELAKMVTRLAFRVRQKSHTVTAEVFVEINSHVQFCAGLLVRFGSGALNTFDEEVKHFFIMHYFNYFAVYF